MSIFRYEMNSTCACKCLASLEVLL